MFSLYYILLFFYTVSTSLKCCIDNFIKCEGSIVKLKIYETESKGFFIIRYKFRFVILNCILLELWWIIFTSRVWFFIEYLEYIFIYWIVSVPYGIGNPSKKIFYLGNYFISIDDTRLRNQSWKEFRCRIVITMISSMFVYYRHFSVNFYAVWLITPDQGWIIAILLTRAEA